MQMTLSKPAIAIKMDSIIIKKSVFILLIKSLIMINSFLPGKKIGSKIEDKLKRVSLNENIWILSNFLFNITLHECIYDKVKFNIHLDNGMVLNWQQAII